MDITDFRAKIGKKVRHERLKHGWTQEELAEKIELHPSFIGQIERGIKAAGFGTLERLSRVFGMTTADFLKENYAPKPCKPQSMERKIVNLLKGSTIHEQETVYQTIKYMLRQKRKLER